MSRGVHIFLPLAFLAGLFPPAASPTMAVLPTVGPEVSCERSGALPALLPPERSDPLLVESEHFVVSYFTSGPDSVVRGSLPGELLGDLEIAYRTLSAGPRCAMRVPFGTHETEAGTHKIEAFVAATEPGYNGHAVRVGPSQAPDAPCSRSEDGYMIVSSSLQSRRTIRLVAAHELMHLFQYVMDADESRWAKESTATWAEWFVFPEDRLVSDTWGSFAYHARPLWSTSPNSLLYSPLFWNFLDQVLGDTVPPVIWGKACTLDWMEALEQTLAERSAGRDSMLHEYAVWNYYAGKRDDGMHYAIQGLAGIQPDVVFTHYPVADSGLAGVYAEEAGSNYLFLSGIASRRDLRVRLRGTPGWKAHRRVRWIGTTGANTHTEFPSMAPSSEEFIVPDWFQYDQVAVIVTNGVNGGAVSPEELLYTVTAMETGGSVVDLAANGGAFPLRVTNPARGGAGIRYRSTGMSERTQLVIYDARGRLVKRLVDRNLRAGDYVATWDGSSESGSRVASGAYVLVLEHAAGSSRCPFVLLR
jgi:hypothetical protein